MKVKLTDEHKNTSEILNVITALFEKTKQKKTQGQLFIQKKIELLSLSLAFSPMQQTTGQQMSSTDSPMQHDATGTTPTSGSSVNVNAKVQGINLFILPDLWL